MRTPQIANIVLTVTNEEIDSTDHTKFVNLNP